MPFLSVSPGRDAARVVVALMRGVVSVLVLMIAALAFLPISPALLLWPLLPRDRIQELLEIFRDWTLSVAAASDPYLPDADPADREPAPALRAVRQKE